MIHSAMQDFDRAGEYRRLRDHYQELSDEELLNLGRDSSDLIEVAQQALARELSRRNLKVEPEKLLSRQRPEAPTIQDPSDPNYDADKQLVSICTVWSLADALQLQKLLDTAGIPFYVGPEKAAVVDEVTSNFADGLQVQIMSIGLPWARSAMKNYFPANDQADENEEDLDEAPVRCPKCNSSEVVLEKTDSLREGVSPQRFKWTCDACGSQWEDDGIVESRSTST